MEALTALRVARWPGGAAAPLNLMVDDLADVWIPAPGCRGRERDWGNLGRGPDSAWRFVERTLLEPFPDLRISLFIPVNRQPLASPPAGSRFHSIAQRPEMVEFLRGLEAHPRVECCYHGKDHFRGEGAARDQEFRTFSSVEEAVAETRRGLEIWDQVFRRPPVGGKYPGYASNDHSDAAVAEAGFRWWCRSFNRGVIQSSHPSTEAMTPAWFVSGRVLDLPSNLAGNVLPPWLRHEWHKWPKRLVQRCRMKRVAHGQIRQLVEHGLPLTLQEHIAPSREDGRRQGVNLQDDRSALAWMLRQACGQPLWHAHPSEIADHWRLRERTRLHFVAGTLRLEMPAVDRLDRLELEVRNPHLAALRGRDGQVHRVRDTARGRFVALPLPLSCDTYHLEERV
jgi:hypothetical protein